MTSMIPMSCRCESLSMSLPALEPRQKGSKPRARSTRVMSEAPSGRQNDASGLRRRRRGLSFGKCGRTRNGELHDERRAGTGHVGERDVASVLHDDPLNDGEAEARAVGLGREVRLEEVRAHLRAEAGTVVAHGE